MSRWEESPAGRLDAGITVVRDKRRGAEARPLCILERIEERQAGESENSVAFQPLPETRDLLRLDLLSGMIYTNQCISLEDDMQVAKWGNSLAVRLPATVVEALNLKEGDQIEIRISGDREFEVTRDKSKDKALARLRRLRRPLPPGFSFSREAANER